VKVFNPGVTPQIVDEVEWGDDGTVTGGGHILGGGEWADVDANPVLQAALDSGRLLTPPTPAAALPSPAGPPSAPPTAPAPEPEGA
jgi:hypothetical protein